MTEAIALSDMTFSRTKQAFIEINVPHKFDRNFMPIKIIVKCRHL